MEAKRPHCLDLMLKDIAKLSTIMRRLLDIYIYIYICTSLINMMRRFMGQRNLSLPKLDLLLCFLHYQVYISKMKTRERCLLLRIGPIGTGKRVDQIVLMPIFWNTIVYSLKVSSPLVRVL